MSEPKEEVLILKGGRGGLGNSHFATSTRQRLTPRFAQDGEPGEEKELILRIKIIGWRRFADLNVGKSTFLSVVTSATPKIAKLSFYNYLTLT